MKRPIALLVVLGLSLCLLAQVSARSYNVLVYPQDQRLSSYLGAFFGSMPYDDAVARAWSLDDWNLKVKALGEALYKAYSSEDGKAIEKARITYEEALGKGPSYALDNEETKDFKVGYVGVPDSLDGTFDIAGAVSQAVNGKDSLSLELLCSLSGADMLVIPIADKLGGFDHTAIYVYRRAYDSIELCFESVSQEPEGLPAQAVLSLSKYFFQHPVSLLGFNGIPQGASVLVDGKNVPFVDGRMLIASGEHSFAVSRQGYEARRFKAIVPENEVCTIEIGLDSLTYGPVKVSSRPAANVYYEGSLLGKTPLVVEGFTIPLVLRFSADGYSNRTISLSSPEEDLFVELKPMWMEDKDLYKKAKDDFYGAFARSLLVFGLKIAAGSLGSAGGLLYEIAGIALDGALVLLLTDLAAKLIDYYRCSEYISP